MDSHASARNSFLRTDSNPKRAIGMFYLCVLTIKNGINYNKNDQFNMLIISRMKQETMVKKQGNNLKIRS